MMKSGLSVGHTAGGAGVTVFTLLTSNVGVIVGTGVLEGVRDGVLVGARVGVNVWLGFGVYDGVSVSVGGNSGGAVVCGMVGEGTAIDTPVVGCSIPHATRTEVKNRNTKICFTGIPLAERESIRLYTIL